MSEILVKFDEPIAGVSTTRYFAEAVGKQVAGGLWEGWLEFIPTTEDGEVLSSGRETTQPNRTNLEYWAQGLTKVYLEGALARAIFRETGGETSAPSESDFEGALSSSSGPPQPCRAPVSPRPILDPFAVYAQGEQILRSELNALSRDHLEAIAKAYGLGAKTTNPQTHPPTAEIVETIIEGVRATT